MKHFSTELEPEEGVMSRFSISAPYMGAYGVTTRATEVTDT